MGKGFKLTVDKSAREPIFTWKQAKVVSNENSIIVVNVSNIDKIESAGILLYHEKIGDCSVQEEMDGSYTLTFEGIVKSSSGFQNFFVFVTTSHASYTNPKVLNVQKPTPTAPPPPEEDSVTIDGYTISPTKIYNNDINLFIVIEGPDINEVTQAWIYERLRFGRKEGVSSVERQYIYHLKDKIILWAFCELFHEHITVEPGKTLSLKLGANNKEKKNFKDIFKRIDADYNEPKIIVTRVQPDIIAADGTPQKVILEGENLDRTTFIKLEVSTEDLYITPETKSKDRLEFTVSIDPNLLSGKKSYVESSVKCFGRTHNNQDPIRIGVEFPDVKPAVTKVTPDFAYFEEGKTELIIEGSNLDKVIHLELFLGSEGHLYLASIETKEKSEDEIKCVLSLSSSDMPKKFPEKISLSVTYEEDHKAGALDISLTDLFELKSPKEDSEYTLTPNQIYSNEKSIITITGPALSEVAEIFLHNELVPKEGGTACWLIEATENEAKFEYQGETRGQTISPGRCRVEIIKRSGLRLATIPDAITILPPKEDSEYTLTPNTVQTNKTETFTIKGPKVSEAHYATVHTPKTEGYTELSPLTKSEPDTATFEFNFKDAEPGMWGISLVNKDRRVIEKIRECLTIISQKKSYHTLTPNQVHNKETDITFTIKGPIPKEAETIYIKSAPGDPPAFTHHSSLVKKTSNEATFTIEEIEVVSTTNSIVICDAAHEELLTIPNCLTITEQNNIQIKLANDLDKDKSLIVLIDTPKVMNKPRTTVKYDNNPEENCPGVWNGSWTKYRGSIEKRNSKTITITLREEGKIVATETFNPSDLEQEDKPPTPTAPPLPEDPPLPHDENPPLVGFGLYSHFALPHTTPLQPPFGLERIQSLKDYSDSIDFKGENLPENATLKPTLYGPFKKVDDNTIQEILDGKIKEANPKHIKLEVREEDTIKTNIKNSYGEPGYYVVLCKALTSENSLLDYNYYLFKIEDHDFFDFNISHWTSKATHLTYKLSDLKHTEGVCRCVISNKSSEEQSFEISTKVTKTHSFGVNLYIPIETEIKFQKGNKKNPNICKVKPKSQENFWIEFKPKDSFDLAKHNGFQISVTCKPLAHNQEKTLTFHVDLLPDDLIRDFDKATNEANRTLVLISSEINKYTVDLESVNTKIETVITTLGKEWTTTEEINEAERLVKTLIGEVADFLNKINFAFDIRTMVRHNKLLKETSYRDLLLEPQKDLETQEIAKIEQRLKDLLDARPPEVKAKLEPVFNKYIDKLKEYLAFRNRQLKEILDEVYKPLDNLLTTFRDKLYKIHKQDLNDKATRQSIASDLKLLQQSLPKQIDNLEKHKHRMNDIVHCHLALTGERRFEHFIEWFHMVHEPGKFNLLPE